MKTNRTVLKVPVHGSASAYAMLHGTLRAYDMTWMHGNFDGISVATPDGPEDFGPGDWMLFNRAGLFRVCPKNTNRLEAGDQIAGVTGDVYDCVITLKYGAQSAGEGLTRLVPDLEKTFPRNLVVGSVIYTDAPHAWLVIPKENPDE